MSKIRILSAILVVALLAAAGWVRLAPPDAVRWHVDVASDTPPLCASGIEIGAASARAACVFPDPPAALLARLDAAALATPRTRRLAGSPAAGRITWETRSLVVGFPDYTTAQVTATPEGTRLDILDRSRFGASDWGVNAARLTGWLGTL